jgi:nucleoside phosphorylase
VRDYAVNRDLHPIEIRESQQYASLEWFIPTAVIVYIAKSYIDGFLNEAGKNNYHALSRAFSSLWGRFFGASKEISDTTFAFPPGKAALRPTYSRSLSLVVGINGISVKLLLADEATAAEFDAATAAFLALVGRIYRGEHDELIERQLELAPPRWDRIMLAYDPRIGRLRVLDTRTGAYVPLVEESAEQIDASSAQVRSSPKVTNDPQIDVAILTIKEEEYVEALNAFAPNPALIRRGKLRDYDVSQVDTPRGPCYVAVTRCIHQGNAHAQSAATNIIDDLAPAFILVVGIAGGVPSTDFTLGDVILSSYIHDLTLEDASADGSRYNALGGPLHSDAARIVERLQGILRSVPKPEPMRPRPNLVGHHTTSIAEWNNAIDESFRHHRESGRIAPLLRAECIASSDRLVKDPELITAWRHVLKGIACAEMESAGVYTVCQRHGTPALAIRGISDIVGWKRDDAWTLYACETAARFAAVIVSSGSLCRTLSVEPPPAGVTYGPQKSPEQRENVEATGTPAEISPTLLAQLSKLPLDSNIHRDAIRVLSHSSFPRLMSFSGQFVTSPMWSAELGDTDRKLIATFSPHGKSPPRVMLLDIFLIKAEDATRRPCLLTYFSGKPSSGWQAFLFPFRERRVGETSQSRLELDATDVAHYLGISRDEVFVGLFAHKYAISVKRDLGLSFRFGGSAAAREPVAS